MLCVIDNLAQLQKLNITSCTDALHFLFFYYITKSNCFTSFYGRCERYNGLVYVYKDYNGFCNHKNNPCLCTEEENRLFTFLMNEFNTCSRTTSISFVIWQYKFIFIVFERIWICHFVKVHTSLQITIWIRLGESDRLLNLYTYMCLHQFIIINHCYM